MRGTHLNGVAVGTRCPASQQAQSKLGMEAVSCDSAPGLKTMLTFWFMVTV